MNRRWKDTRPVFSHGISGTRQNLQAVEKRTLSWNDLFPGDSKREPLRPIDLRKILSAPAPWRPLQLEHIALDRAHIEIAFDGKGDDALSALLDHLAQGQRNTPRRTAAKLLRKFAQRSSLGFLARIIFAFGDRPCFEVAIAPEGSTRMDKKHFENPVPAAIDKQAGTGFGHMFETTPAMSVALVGKLTLAPEANTALEPGAYLGECQKSALCDKPVFKEGQLFSRSYISAAAGLFSNSHVVSSRLAHGRAITSIPSCAGDLPISRRSSWRLSTS